MTATAERETAEPEGPVRFPARPDGSVSQDMLRAWERDGFLILDDFANARDCAALIDRAAAIVTDFDPAQATTVFSTTSQAHARDDYFLDSGGKIRCFLEEEAVGPDGAVVRNKSQAVNKIGHALHDLDPVYDAFSRKPNIARLVAAMGIADAKLLQSMHIFKQPGIGGEVVWHQDATFLHTEPPGLLGLWFALEDATRENGCLEAVPGAHRGPLRAHFRRHGKGTITDRLDPMPWPEQGCLALEAKAGTLIVLNALLPHRSGANRSACSRQAYTMHVVDGRSAYPASNWLRRGADMPPRGFR